MQRSFSTALLEKYTTVKGDVVTPLHAEVIFDFLPEKNTSGEVIMS
jgi:hypothetical protein